MYSDPILRAYIELIKSKTSAFKMFYEGEPVKIPVSNLPCVIVSKEATRVGPINNAEDQHEMAIRFRVITDIRDDLSTDKDAGAINAGLCTLYDMIEGRNEDFSLKTTSLMKILRGNLLAKASPQLRTDLSSFTEATYGVQLAGREQQQWRVQASVDILSTFVQVR